MTIDSRVSSCFEHLGRFKPEKGKYSKRANSKRSYWLRGRIFRYTRYKVWEHGVITSRVSPRDTSRLCASCGVEVARHGENDKPEGCRPGAPLFSCQCGKRGNADLNVVRNVANKFFFDICGITQLPKPLPKGRGGLISHE